MSSASSSSARCWGSNSEESTSLKPQDFLLEYGLPQLTRLQEGYTIPGSNNVDLKRPLLLFKAYTCRKVHARSIDRDNFGIVRTVGPPLLIPDTYAGWLAVITEDGRTAGYFQSIAEVALAHVPCFLTVDHIHGYSLIGTSYRSRKVKIKGGEVLQFLGAYEDTLSSAKRRKIYAKVINRQGDLLYLPFTCMGKFYSVAGRRTRSVSHVFQISQLLGVSTLPLTVRIVASSGSDGSKSRPSSFTGLLRLDWSETQHVILAAIKGFGTSSPKLLEINVESNFCFRRPSTNDAVRTSKSFQKLLRYCREEGQVWIRQIKVAHDLFPLVSWSRSHKGSTKDTNDQDSAIRSSTVRSLSSCKSSSASSRLLKGLRLLHNSWKRRPSIALTRFDETRKLKTCVSDFHMYETVRDEIGRRFSWDRSSVTTAILDDDGYVTSDFDEDYDSVC